MAVPGAAADIVLYASADGTGGYFNGTYYKAPSLPVLLSSLHGTLQEPTTVQLLTAEEKPTQPTVFRNETAVGACAFAVQGVRGTANARLTIKGVRDGVRFLTQMQGITVQDVIDKQFHCGSSINILALEGLARVDDAPAGGLLHSDDLLEEFGAQEASNKAMLHLFSVGAQKTLVRCLKIAESNAIDIVDMAFKDCWLPAVFVRDSTDVTLSHAFIEGSSYAFFAMSTTDPNKAKTFKVLNTTWIQDTTGYGAGKPAECQTPSAEHDCPGDMWSKIPWGVTHDLEFEHMNGALFGSINVAGDVKFIGNTLRNAYNGLRMVAKDCNATCLKSINRDVEIADNKFVYLRDNPIEPESVAYNWKIHGNDFKNSHGWISLDGVAGGPIYVYANTGWHTDIPGRACDPDVEPVPHQVNFKEGGWRDATSAEDLSCTASTFGTVMKVGENSNVSPSYVFHNSWSIRTPLVRGGVTGPIHHWNNAIDYTGCGTGGDPLCAIQTSGGDPYCKGMKDLFAPGDKSLIFRCVDGKQLSDPKRYDFAYDISSQGFPAAMAAEIAAGPGAKPTDPMFTGPGDFRLKTQSPAIGAGCIIKVKGAALTCEKPAQAGADIGAFKKDGARYQPPAIP